MSNKGTVYAISAVEGSKLAYKVVYRNKDVLVCKVNGTTGVKEFRFPDAKGYYTKVTLLDDYLNFPNKTNFRGYVFVDANQSYDFPELVHSHKTALINSLKNRIENIQHQIGINKALIKEYQNDIQTMEHNLEKLLKELELQKKSLLKFEQEESV